MKGNDKEKVNESESEREREREKIIKRERDKERNRAREKEWRREREKERNAASGLASILRASRVCKHGTKRQRLADGAPRRPGKQSNGERKRRRQNGWD